MITISCCILFGGSVDCYVVLAYLLSFCFSLVPPSHSIAFHFRYTEDADDDDSVKVKTGILNKIGRRLNYLAHHYGLIVIVTNQMTTKFGKDGMYEKGKPSCKIIRGYSNLSNNFESSEFVQISK